MKKAKVPMNQQIDQDAIDYKYELMRKSIHLCSLSIPIIYYFITEELALTILIPLAVFSLVLDLGRHILPFLGELFSKMFGFLLRSHETDKKNLSGATYVFIAAVFSLIILPKIFFIIGFTALILSDTAAALVGRRYGKHKFLFKSFEGTLAFFVVGCIIVFFAPKVEGIVAEYIIGIIAMAIGAIGENVSYGWADDNLVIPFSIGLAMWGMYAFFLPELNVALYSPLMKLF